MPPVERKLTAAEIMTPAPRTCSKFSTVLEAVMIFRDADCGIVPVVEDGKPIGVLTDRDVALAVADYPDLASRSVADVMTKDVVSVAPDTTLNQLQERFGAEGVRRLLVVDADDRLLGVISWADIAPHAPDPTVGRVVSDVVEQP
jgi:CBS domain-containing protein